MNLPCVVACLTLAAFLSADALATPAIECTFDQAHQAAALARIAARHPGGVIDTHGPSITWHLRDGSSITAGQGGCMDYGTSIRWTFPPGPRPPLANALARLITLTARYLPARYAKDLAAARAHHQFRQSVAEDGSIKLDAERDSTSLSRSLEIDLTKTEITAGWQEL